MPTSPPRIWLAAAAISMAWLMIGCGGPPAAGGDDGTTGSPARPTEAATQRPAAVATGIRSPAATPGTLASPTRPPSAPVAATTAAQPAAPPSRGDQEEKAVTAARIAVARETRLRARTLRVASVRAEEWPDAGLGCPEPGMAYAEVLTPGHRVVLEAGGNRYEVHTSDAGAAVVCDEEEAGGTMQPRTDGGGAEQAERAARELVAREARVAAAALQLVSSAASEWPDSSLGCPEEGMMYMQVITPGYLVVLEAEGRRYEVHTDATGRAVLCGQ